MSPEAERFVQWLQRVGDGQEVVYNDSLRKDLIRMPSEMVLDSLPDLIGFVFPDLTDEDAVSKSAILTPLKVHAYMVNEIILDFLPGNVVSRYSYDRHLEGASLSCIGDRRLRVTTHGARGFARSSADVNASA